MNCTGYVSQCTRDSTTTWRNKADNTQSPYACHDKDTIILLILPAYLTRLITSLLRASRHAEF